MSTNNNSYTENFSGKFQWLSPFERGSSFPLDRSSIFSSYADALAYAKQDGSDSRGLGITSYIGQIIAVYGLDITGNNIEISAYIITGVGKDTAALMKLAQTSATGDFTDDINRIDNSLTALGNRIKALEDKPDVVDTNTTYTFQTAVTTDGAIKYTQHNSDGTTESAEVLIKGWLNLVELASGRTQAFSYTNKLALIDSGDLKNSKKFKVGDLIYYTATDVADQWVTEKFEAADTSGNWYALADLETEKVSLVDYITSAEIARTYATKDEISSLITIQPVTELGNRIDGELQTITGDISDLEEAIGTIKTDASGNVIPLQTQLNDINVTGQISNYINNNLNVNNVGGAERSYIKSVKQVDGKIEAVAATLPEVTVAQVTDNQAGEQGDGEIAVVTSIVEDVDDHKLTATSSYAVRQSYVETLIEQSATAIKNELIGSSSSSGDTISSVSARVKVIEDANYPKQIADINNSITQLDTKITTDILSTTNENSIASRLTAVETLSGNTKSALDTLTTQVNTNKSDVAQLKTDVSGVIAHIATSRLRVDATSDPNDATKASGPRIDKLSMGVSDGNGGYTYTERFISTDLLTTGKNVLILNCGDAKNIVSNS